MDSVKIMTRSDLVVAFGPGEDTVVFTNGVFDLLHPGHVHLLREAAAIGDALVVGVNSDASAATLRKGYGPPFDSERDRAFMVAALSCVDAVTIFEEETPEELIRELGPTFLVKGKEYAPHEVVGSDIIEEAGGFVALVPMLGDYSTRGRIAAIRQRGYQPKVPA